MVAAAGRPPRFLTAVRGTSQDGRMTSSPIRHRILQAAGVVVVAIFMLLLAGAGIVIRSGREADVVRAELERRSEGHALRPESERAGIVRLARGARVSDASAVSPRSDGPDQPLHDWLAAVRLARAQPGPPPPPEALAELDDLAPALDALAQELSRVVAGESAPFVAGESAPFVAPGDRESRAGLERARTLLLAAGCAESLRATGDPARGERMLDAAWTLHRGLPVGIDDAGPGDLLLAVLRQARVADARAWDERIVGLPPQARLAEALEWDAAARMARLERTVERRRHPQPGWMPAPVQRLLGAVASGHDTHFTSRIARAETALADEVRALDPCDDPWALRELRAGELARIRPMPAEVRLRIALASASLAQADVALTRHVLLRRHGLAAPRDACGQELIERPLGDGRHVVGWRVAGTDEPGPAGRDRPRNHSVGFRTFPEPSLPGPPLAPFTFAAPS